MFFWNSLVFQRSKRFGNLISGSSVFSKTTLNIWKFTVHILLKPGLENFEHYFTSVWDEGHTLGLKHPHCTSAVGDHPPTTPHSSDTGTQSFLREQILLPFLITQFITENFLSLSEAEAGPPSQNSPSHFSGEFNLAMNKIKPEKSWS